MGVVHTLPNRSDPTPLPADDGAVDRVLATAVDAGVKLYVAAPHEDGTRLMARSGGAMTAELRRGIEAHRSEIAVRILASQPIPIRAGQPSYARQATLGEVWGRTALESQFRYGSAVARLYPLIGEDVKTSQGDAMLVNVLCGTARVLTTADVMRGPLGDDKYVGTKDIPLADVYPMLPARSLQKYVPIPAVAATVYDTEQTAPDTTVGDLAARRRERGA